MFGLGFLGTLLVVAIIYYFWSKKTSKDNKFLAEDAIDRTTEMVICGIHKGLDEVEAIVSDGTSLAEYKKELVARRLAARNTKKDIS